MRKYVWLAVLLLAGCGGGSQQQAIDACEAELNSKLSGKSFKLDASKRSVKSENDQILVSATVVFDAGLPGEYTQPYECKVRVADGKAEVISLIFNW